ncbi:hypothetical protein KIN20_032833 [Parelaphostrongylus tenuis]|uniref:Uncharacterized protein n=1 Tax=Parelaphostrongylus tenuis TaxID=148309 RepID=A0AAD5R6Z7_PARTN|nr:hypothetical protein KIN20_032833 [Parelaphostrongylus tenuis]
MVTITTPITTTSEPPQVIYLSEYNRTDYNELVTTVTKPLGHTIRTVPKTATVHARPYENVHIATRKNPDYVGESIWASIDLLPEPMGFGPVSRTHLLQNNTRSFAWTTTPKITTTTAKKTQNAWPPSEHRRKASTTTVKPTFAEKSTAVTFSTFLSATTTKLAKSRTSPSFTVYPVRPTTPMGDLITTTTMKVSETADFPRTALISVASVSVIMIIAIVVFCVFRCRQNPPPSDHYPMVCNGKTQQGYTAIAPDMSPPPPGLDHATQPLLGRPALQVNGNGYQSMKGAGIITNNNIINGHARNGGIGKKDFKEWYV